jgi:hypothetical protein
MFRAIFADVAVVFSLHSKVSRLIQANNSSASEHQNQVYAAYGGSASCRECHAKEYSAWANLHHALAERVPDAAQDNAAFGNE